MPKICYQKITFRDADKIDAVSTANRLIETYQRQGYILTLRQLYYQFVAKDLFSESRKWSWTGAKWVRDSAGTKNAEPNYKWLGDVVADARMGGYIDWEAVEDRTREIDAVSHWETPSAILRTCHNSFRVDKWTTQKTRIEVWVEKDAIEGIAKKAAHAQDVPLFSCRGYGSLSSLWESANRLKEHIKKGQKVVLLHLGDHDPSGIDMSRDIADRLNKFIWTDLIREVAGHFDEDDKKGENFSGLVIDTASREYGFDEEDLWEKKVIEVRRIALTMDQINQYNPPPNPAKATDARYKEYQKLHGDESWELDALEPSVLDSLITSEIDKIKDHELYAQREGEEKGHRDQLKAASDHWDDGLAEVVEKYRPKKPPPRRKSTKETGQHR